MTDRTEMEAGTLVLVLGTEPSSLTFAVYRIAGAASWRLAARGRIDGIGTSPRLATRDAMDDLLDGWTLDGSVRDEDTAVAALAGWLRGRFCEPRVSGVGHRVAYGGARHAVPAVVTPRLVDELRALVPLAPRNQPHDLAAIAAVARRFPGVPQVACFETSFHCGHRAAADLVSLPLESRRAGARRHGFHGLTYEYVASVLPRLAPEIAERRVIVARLGTDARLCALVNGKSIDGSCGFTALDGLWRGTRLDPVVALHVAQRLGLSIEAVGALLDEQSGRLGVSGLRPDVRDLLASRAPGARLAVDGFVYRVAKEIGALAASLRGLDALVFTAGIGERCAEIRERICRASSWLGVELDASANATHALRISAPQSSVSVWAIPTNDELMVARHTAALLGLTAGQVPAAGAAPLSAAGPAAIRPRRARRSIGRPTVHLRLADPAGSIT